MWTTTDGYTLRISDARLRRITPRFGRPGMRVLMDDDSGGTRRAVTRALGRLARNAFKSGTLRSRTTGRVLERFSTHAAGHAFSIFARPDRQGRLSIVAVSTAEEGAEYSDGPGHQLIQRHLDDELIRMGLIFQPFDGAGNNPQHIRHNRDQVKTGTTETNSKQNVDVSYVADTPNQMRVNVEMDTQEDNRKEHLRQQVLFDPNAYVTGVLINDTTGAVQNRLTYDPTQYTEEQKRAIRARIEADSTFVPGNVDTDRDLTNLPAPRHYPPGTPPKPPQVSFKRWPTPTPTQTQTPTATQTHTPTQTQTATPTRTPTPTRPANPRQQRIRRPTPRRLPPGQPTPRSLPRAPQSGPRGALPPAPPVVGPGTTAVGGPLAGLGAGLTTLAGTLGMAGLAGAASRFLPTFGGPTAAPTRQPTPTPTRRPATRQQQRRTTPTWHPPLLPPPQTAIPAAPTPVWSSPFLNNLLSSRPPQQPRATVPLRPPQQQRPAAAQRPNVFAGARAGARAAAPPAAPRSVFAGARAGARPSAARRPPTRRLREFEFEGEFENEFENEWEGEWEGELEGEWEDYY